MTVDTMRTIDHLAGVPLTFLATLVRKTINFFSPQENTKTTNALFIELSEMGSAILVDPAMRKLQKNIDGELFFVIFSKNAISLEILKTVKKENIFKFDESSLVALAKSTIEFTSWCRKNNIDTVIDLELFSRFTALLSFLSFAKKVVGFHSFHNEGLYRGDLLTRKVAYNPHMHITKNFIALINATLSEKDELPFSKTIISDDELVLAQAEVNEDAKNKVLDIIRSMYIDYDDNPIILVNSNASDLLPQRRWDRQNYCEVINKILAHNDKTIVLLTGSPAEYDGVDELRVCVNDARCINFCGAVKFLELMPLYQVSKFMLTNDSGPAHFASTTDMHTFVIFGPETPALYGSLGPTTPIYSHMSCSPCVSASNHRKTPCSDNQCIQVIDSEWVFNALLPKLELL